jgi:hypothetical protein
MPIWYLLNSRCRSISFMQTEKMMLKTMNGSKHAIFNTRRCCKSAQCAFKRFGKLSASRFAHMQDMPHLHRHPLPGAYMVGWNVCVIKHIVIRTSKRTRESSLDQPCPKVRRTFSHSQRNRALKHEEHHWIPRDSRRFPLPKAVPFFQILQALWLHFRPRLMWSTR